MPRTITEGSVDLDKFCASRVRQLARKLRELQSHCTPYQASCQWPTSDSNQPSVAPETELLTARHSKKRRPMNKQRQAHHKPPEKQVTGQVKKHYDNRTVHKSKDRNNNCGDSTHVKGFSCPAKKYQCKVCHKYGHFSSLCYQKKNQAHHKSNIRNPKAHQLKAGPVYAHDSSICSHSDELSSDESFCLWLQVKHNQVQGKKIPIPVHLVTNIAYRLKLHHNRNMYLWARLDTCADINIMPASV